MVKFVHFLVIVALVAMGSCLVSANDPSAVQDFCVAVEDSTSAVLVNGKFCKKVASADDFFFTGLNVELDTSQDISGSNATIVDVSMIPGLNTLGVSIGRVDFVPDGVNAPHFHPRASEILLVLQGRLDVGFVTSNPTNTLFSKTLNVGDAFVFPVGLVHFQINRGKIHAVAMVAFSSQNPGRTTIANGVFGSDPHISIDVLTKAFQLDKNIVSDLQTKF